MKSFLKSKSLLKGSLSAKDKLVQKVGLASKDKAADKEAPVLKNKIEKGHFISFEGGEGAGKSTQVRILSDHLAALGFKTLLTREPGGSPLGEKIRRFLLEGKVKDYGAVAEALLFYTARHDHLEKLILPNLSQGAWVICDRFADSSRAYQGAASGVDDGIFDALDRIVVGENQPELTIIVDLPVDLAMRRVEARQKKDGLEIDRFESEDMQFHERLRAGFLNIAATNANRCIIIDGNQSREKVAELVWQTVAERFGLEGVV